MLRSSSALWPLAALLCVLAAGSVRADGPPGYVGEAPERLRASVVVPTDPLNPQPKKRFGCWASHFGNGCGSFHSDMVFIFGSCRSFFGEGCRKDPPSIYPPGYGPAYPAGYGPSGYGAAAGGGCNCP